MTDPSRSFLRIRGLRKAFAAPGGTTIALEGIDLDIERGSFVSIVGPSGCGKSTLLQIMAGLVAPTSGAVFLEDRKVEVPPPTVIYVFQQYTRSLFPWKTVERNVAFGLESRESLSRQAIAARTRELIGLVKLTGFEQHYPWQLSGGMQQRVAIARALACRPAVLLMDEPFSAVDALTRVGLQELLRALWRELGLTVVFVTHDVDEGVYLSTRVVALTRAPGAVAADLPIELPHPRNQITTRELPQQPRLPRSAARTALRRRRAGRDGASVSDIAGTERAALAAPAGKPRRRLAALWESRWLGVAFIVALLVLREIAAATGMMPAMSFPRMSAILATWWDLIVSGELLGELVPSLWRMFAGYFIGVALGVLVGLLMGYVRFFYTLLEPITEVLRPIPSPAYLPIVILFLGIDDEMKIFMIAFASFFPVLLNTYSGVRSVDPVQLQTARTFGVAGWKLLWQIVLPASSPYIFTGMRVSLAVALIVMVISEMVAASSGIGYFILSAQRGFKIREMFAGVLTLAALGYVLNRLFLAIENRVLAWHYGYTQQQRN
jgi:ABC-type nitrate/sulfonate/bicarbonate transport system ATPase subunit/ABC-type nitrate/sulfonate/bicarbonate transport system permease component